MRIPDVWHRLPIRTINITFTIPAHRRLVAHHITSRIYSRVSVHARTHARTHSLTHLRTHARTHARTIARSKVFPGFERAHTQTILRFFDKFLSFAVDRDALCNQTRSSFEYRALKFPQVFFRWVE